jgi:uncharacterized protein (DUF983 family)
MSTRTLHKTNGGNFSCGCPTCGSCILIDGDLKVVAKCEHFARRWRVSADGRVRAEFRSDTLVTTA